MVDGDGILRKRDPLTEEDCLALLQSKRLDRCEINGLDDRP